MAAGFIGTFTAIVGAWVLLFQGIFTGFGLSLIAWLACLVCLVWMILGVRKAEKRSAPRRRMGWACAFLVLVLVTFTAGHVIVIWNGLYIIGYSMSAAGGLVGIRYGVQIYDEKHHRYPPTLQDIFDTGAVHELCFASKYDPDLPAKIADGGRLLYSSFTYNPPPGPLMNDSELVIAYERKPVRLVRDTLFKEPRRTVLFEDGDTQHMTELEFAEVLRKDAARRASRTPASQPASQTG